ncbi:mucin-7-like [Schistocerca piceifrons]|uniref:mucin-7-like n=1 Tax=Schistocerca piceifrons TaxID=274613 RepID=UPI001F5F006C|nr:mucin-7-like [Schistocerca piceifrons]
MHLKIPDEPPLFNTAVESTAASEEPPSVTAEVAPPATPPSPSPAAAEETPSATAEAAPPAVEPVTIAAALSPTPAVAEPTALPVIAGTTPPPAATRPTPPPAATRPNSPPAETEPAPPPSTSGLAEKNRPVTIAHSSTTKQLSWFLDMLNFFHRNLPPSTELQEPLTAVLSGPMSKGNSVITGADGMSLAFEAAKKSITDAALFMYTNPNASLPLVVDVSQLVTGMVLQQQCGDV